MEYHKSYGQKVVQFIPAVILLLAFIAGKGTLHLTGLRIPLLAHDNIAYSIILAFASSLLTGGVFLARFSLDHNRLDKQSFIVCWLTALLAISAFVHATGHVTINGISLRVFTWPAGAVLTMMMGYFLIISMHKGTSQHGG